MPNDTPPTPTDLITRRVRELRERRGFTQEQLAERVTALGVVLHQSAIARIEKGHRRVTLEEAVRLALALDVPLGALFLPLDDGPVSLAPNFRIDGDLAHEWLAGLMFVPWSADESGHPTWPPLEERCIDNEGPTIDMESVGRRSQDFANSRPLSQQEAFDAPGVAHLFELAMTYVRAAGRKGRSVEMVRLDTMRRTLERMSDEIARQYHELDRLEAEGSER